MSTTTRSTLSFSERLHYYHRFWRYATRTEPDTIRFIRNEFSSGGVAFDIGANKGIVTWFLGKKAGQTGKVYAFEPQPEMGEQIECVANSFGLGSVVEVNSFGLSDHADTMTLFRGKPGGTANLVKGSDWQTDSVEVEIKTLDSFVEESGIEKIDFIKCDVDGYEEPVVKGASRTFKEFGPKLLIEIGEKDLPVISEMLADYGYDGGVFLHKGQIHPASETKNVGNRKSGVTWRNFLFKKRV